MALAMVASAALGVEGEARTDQVSHEGPTSVVVEVEPQAAYRSVRAPSDRAATLERRDDSGGAEGQVAATDGDRLQEDRPQLAANDPGQVTWLALVDSSEAPQTAIASPPRPQPRAMRR